MNPDTETHTAPAQPVDDTELLATDVVTPPELAWSAADDIPTVAYRSRRGWATAITAVTIATAAAVSGGIYLLQQHHPAQPAPPPPAAAPLPPPTVKPPPPPTDPDSRFISQLQEDGIVFHGSRPEILAAGHAICIDLSHGYTMQDIVTETENGAGRTPAEATLIAVTAVNTFCPGQQY